MTRSASSSTDSPSAGSESTDSADDRPRSDSSTTRRRHLATTAGTGLLAAIAGCASLDSNGSTGENDSTEETEPPDRDETTPDDAENVDDLPLFDAHTHLIPTEARGRDPLSVDDLVAWMDDVGVDRAAVHALDSPESYPVQVPSWWVLEEVSAYPDRLVPFCTIDPRTQVYGEDTLEELLERYVDRGARGFGELKAGMDVDDERLEPIYELCSDLELPILFHTDTQAMVDEVGLPRFEDVLASYPDVAFIPHAHAWWAHVSGDVESGDLGAIPEGPVADGGRVPELLEEYDNVYGDLSTLAGWNALVRDEAFGQEFLENHHDQLVFGTDYLFPGQEIPHVDLFDRFDLDLEAWADIRYRNAESLLR